MDESWLTSVRYIMMGVYNIPELMGFRYSDGEVFIHNVLAREEALYVKHPAEEEIYKQLDKLLVVKGPKGDGLSVAAMAALARRMILDRAVVVDAADGDDLDRLTYIVDSIREVGREPIFYLDLSQPGHYTQRPWDEDAWYAPRKLDEFVKALETVHEVSLNKDVAVVTVLSSDLYEVLRNKLKEHATVEVNSNDVRFLKELVQAYSDCGEEEVAKEVAEAVARRDCGRAVLATLAADWLSQRNCRDVDEALRAAEEKAKELYVEYIWRTVLNGDHEEANIHAPLLLLRHFEGPMSTETAEEFLVSLGSEKDKVWGSLAVQWIAMPHCSLIEGAIKKAVEVAMTKKVDEQPYTALRSALVYYQKHFKARGHLK
jgi:hypothetical protein